jgi:hypothetical protein
MGQKNGTMNTGKLDISPFSKGSSRRTLSEEEVMLLSLERLFMFPS